MSILSNNFYYQPLKIDSINTKVYGDFIAKEGDANGRGLLVTLTENGLQKDTTGITLNLKWAHTTVLGLQNLDPFESVDLTKGLYKITYPTDMLRKGKVDAFIQIIDSGKLIGSRNIKINVEATVGDDTAIESSNEFRALASALVEVNGWNDRIDAVEADFIQRANDMEATYPQELLSLGSQLADKASLAQLSQVASPKVASLAAQMTDITKVYVYTGAEGGYIAGNWYYHTGTVWANGGVYQSTGIADGSIDYNKLSNDLRPILGGYTPLAFDNLLTGIAYYDYTDGVNPAWDGVQYPGYNTYVKNVVPGERYQITNYVVAEIFAVAQFRTAEDVGGPWVGLGMIGQQSDYQVTVPDGMAKMIVTYATEQSLPSVKKFQVADVSLTQVDLDVKSSYKNALRYNHANKSVRMRFRYNSIHDMVFDIGKRGSSNLPQIAAFYKEPNTTGYLPMDFTLTTQFIADQTDWISPYVVKAKANIDGDLPLSEHFTGGYHGYNNGASDAVGTATNTSFKVFADKKLLTADCDIYANEIVIEVVNLINATNTKKADGTGRNVIQETVTYTIVGNKVDVSVAIKALEDITIQTYYGIQAYVVAFNSFQFVGDNVMTGVFDTTAGHYGGHKADSDCNVMLAMTATDKLTMFVDNMFGIGKLRYLEATTGVCAYMNYGKMYFYLINNHDFTANTVLNYRGGYVFESLT